MMGFARAQPILRTLDNNSAKAQHITLMDERRIWRLSVREEIMSTTHRRGRTPSPDLVAGNGLMDRRALLGKGIPVAGARGAAGPITGAAAEPLKDEQGSLEFGSIMPPVQMA